MRFFDKFLKKKVSAPEKMKGLIPRPPRIKSDLLGDLEFHLKTNDGNIKLDVNDISSRGISFKLGSHQILENEQSGLLILDGISFPVELTVIHNKENLAGCKYTKIPANFLKIFAETFKYPLIASSFSQIEQAYLKKTQEGEAHWYCDKLKNEVFFVSKGSTVLQFHIAIDCFYLEGEQGNSIKTKSPNIEIRQKMGVEAPEFVQFDVTPNPDVILRAIKLLYSLRSFHQGEFDLLLEILAQK